MLYWSAVFFVIALIAAYFGYGDVSNAASSIAQVLFFLFVAAFLVTLVAGLVAGRKVKREITGRM